MINLDLYNVKGESKSNMKILPWWIKLGLLLTGVYQDMKTFAIPAVKLHEKTSAEVSLIEKNTQLF